jgi:type II secretory pathway pseudopilin PulG
VEILVVAVILAVVGTFLYQYFLSTTKTVETIQQQKPMSAARLAADRATVAAIRTSLQLYFGEHGGYPPSKDVVATLLNPPPSLPVRGERLPLRAGHRPGHPRHRRREPLLARRTGRKGAAAPGRQG